MTVHPGSKAFTISPYAVGLHSVYCSEPDALYADGKLADWARKVGIGVMRFPGGNTVKTWDWKNPAGAMQNDPWDPAFDESKRVDPSQWMSLDEYLAFVRRSGVTPLFGVNMYSGNRFKRLDDSVARAVEMVRYVKEQGFGGAFWYIGNEEYVDPKVYVAHARAMKAEDPDIRCMYNENDLTPEKIKKFLQRAGDWVDIIETHGKWPSGGGRKWPGGTFVEWQKEKPLVDRKNHARVWRNIVADYKAAAAEAGYPDIEFADNEYGLGRANNVEGFNRYTKGLAIVDMLQEHIIGQWTMTCFWSNLLTLHGEKNVNADKEYGDERGLVSALHGYRMNPSALGFELLADAAGADMLAYAETDLPSVYGFAARREGRIMVFILNKSGDRVPLTVRFAPPADRLAFEGGSSMTDTPDHFGARIPATLKRKDDAFTGALPPLSYTRFDFGDTDKAP